MGTYLRGNEVTIVNRFYTVDPLTQGPGVLADPTTVTFTVQTPDHVQTDYVFGVDANVTNPAVGVYLCALTPPLPTGTYRYRCVGTGAVEAADEDTFFILASGVLAPNNGDIPVEGPCSDWITGSDVANCGPDLGVGSDTWLFDTVASDASLVMWELSGRKYPGVCLRTVRPCMNECNHWASYASGLAVWSWTTNWVGGGGGWAWRDQFGNTCGCNPLSKVRLSGFPVREIVEVKIDGVVLDPLDINGNPNYRLDFRRELVRMDDPSGTSVKPRFWPGCQNLALDDTQDGTFSISYRWGQDPPTLGKAAAAQLARELYKACSGDKCALPSKVTKVVRQGVTYEKVVPVAQLLRQGSTGLPLLDTFIATVNPTGRRRRTAIYSPDVQQYAKKVGG